MNAILKPASSMHPDEWAARVELAACYRVFAMLGWTEMIYNHITVRLPASVAGSEKQFLINPFGLHYSEVTASNLLKIDVHGKKLDDNPWPVNPAGFTMHAAIHEACGRAHCVMHTHTTAGIAVACTQGGLAQNNFYSAQLHDMVAYHDFEGITIHADEAPRLLASMGHKPLLILRNHGLLACGETLPLAFVRLVDAATRLRDSSSPRPRWARPFPCRKPWRKRPHTTRSSSTRSSARARTCSARWCGRLNGIDTQL
jgi:ribulose-5-phosphate 4-epimerase/fuculose-1-phosphate aldolase